MQLVVPFVTCKIRYTPRRDGCGKLGPSARAFATVPPILGEANLTTPFDLLTEQERKEIRLPGGSLMTIMLEQVTKVAAD